MPSRTNTGPALTALSAAKIDNGSGLTLAVEAIPYKRTRGASECPLLARSGHCLPDGVSSLNLLCRLLKDKLRV